MVKLPEPPSAQELARAKPRPSELRRLGARTSLWRVYFRGGPYPTGWRDFRFAGPTSARFDPHVDSRSDRGVLYSAPLAPTCLAEVFQDGRTIDLRTNDPWLVEFELTRPVTLLDLTGAWITRAGASGAIGSGPRQRARRWSVAIYDAFPAVEGLLYTSSMYPGTDAVVLYERAADAMPDRPATHRALADPSLFDGIADAASTLGYGLV